MAIELINKRADLSLLSIEASEELQRLKLGKDTKLINVKELSKLIKKEFRERWDYVKIFREAYKSSFNETIPGSSIKIPKEYINGLSNSLENPSNLEKELELKSLIEFCVNLSDYAAQYKEEINSLRVSKYGRF